MNSSPDLLADPLPLPLTDAVVTLVDDFVAQWEADSLFRELLAEIHWQSESIRLYGRQVTVPRLVAWYGDSGASYSYSGVRHEPLPWAGALANLRERVSEVCGARFNSVLANRYRDGNDAMGWHSDDEPELGSRPVIASLSLGATRKMRFRHRRKTHPSTGFALPAGSLLIMAGDTQANWQHCITRTRKPLGERINLTFRQIG